MPDAQPPSAAGKPFRLPDLGEGLTEAEIVSWHVEPGDHVVADQPLVAVETDKAIVEIPAPHAGRITQLNVEVGTLIKVGEVLLTFAADDVDAAEPAATVVGELIQAPVQPRKQSTPDTVASPRTRLRARELGVDLKQVEATGPGGVIQLSDVERAATSEGDQPLTGVRRAMAQRMADAHARVARASVNDHANISTWSPQSHLMSRLIRAIGVACSAQPLLNARFDDRTATLTHQNEVHLGIAMETAYGLLVPVLRDITRLDQTEIPQQLEALKTQVQERRSQPQQLRGQTITLSNYGAVGGRYAEMIVVPPQVAIVGAGRSFQQVVLRDGAPHEQTTLPLSLSFDHRAVTGIEACQFLLALIEDLELSQ